MRLLVIGAGIGGLAASVALEQADHEVVLVERAQPGEPAGLGIAMGPNALAALGRLGAADHVRETGNTAAGRRIFTRSGRQLSEGPWQGGVIRRADLHDALRLRLCVAVQYGRRCVAVEQDGSGVVTRFEDGSSELTDAVIAADGLRSTVRAQLFRDGEPIYRGSTSFRGIARYTHPLIADHITETWGHGSRIGLQNLGEGWTYWFAALNAPPGTQMAPAEARTMLLETFLNWHDPIEDVLRATEEERLLQTDLCDRDPLPRWSTGRVALLGDAAHPMTPDLGQGGAQAIEDAVALGQVMDGATDLVSALRRYEERRMPVAYDVLRRARRHYRIAQLSNPVLCGVRDRTVGHLPAAAARRLGLRRPAWIETERSAATHL